MFVQHFEQKNLEIYKVWVITLCLQHNLIDLIEISCITNITKSFGFEELLRTNSEI